MPVRKSVKFNGPASEEGLTPLHVAAIQGHINVVKLLVDAGMACSTQDESRKNALHYAAENGHLEVVEWLIDHVNQADTDATGCTPVDLALEKGYFEIVKLLLSKNQKAEESDTLLHNAARIGFSKFVKSPMSLDIDKTAPDADGFNALHIASWKGNLEFVKQLLPEGGSRNENCGSKGSTLCHDSSATPRDTGTATEPASQIAIVRTPTIEYIDVTDDEGNTPLMLASQQGHNQVVEFLLQKDANPNHQNQDGDGALHEAVAGQHVEAVKLLISAGANVNMRNKTLFTPLHQSVWGNSCPHIVQILLDAGAKWEKRIDFPLTPMHLAAHHGFAESMKTLLEAKADPNVKGGLSGRTPLHLAVESQSTVEVLLAHGADVTAKTKDGETALHCAARVGNEEVVKLLLDRLPGLGMPAVKKEGKEITNKRRSTVKAEEGRGTASKRIRLS